MKLRVQAIMRPNSGCDYHRVQLPFAFAGQYIDQEFYKDFSHENYEHYLFNSQVVVFNRFFPLPIEKFHALKAKGIKLVCDVDDYWILNAEHPLFENYRNGWAQDIIKFMQMADLVTTTTPRLADSIMSYNKNVEVIPNALPFGFKQFVEGEKGNAFVYAGQSSHLKDVMLLDREMGELSKIKGLTFHLGGYTKHPIYFKMQSVFNKVDNPKMIDALPLQDYMNVYDGAGCSLVPLVDNNFNSKKSNLKLLEAAAKKLPAIVSHVAPYSDDEDAPVLWVKNRGDWVKHIKALHESEMMRQEYGEALHEWATEKYHLADWNKVRFEIYELLINK